MDVPYHVKWLVPYIIPISCVLLLGFTNSWWPEKHAYSTLPFPEYITRINGHDNPISDAGATLGRVLFYDKTLSLNKSIACASCHRQKFAFGDSAAFSTGFSGLATKRHSMRLVNVRFGDEEKFFWNERAESLEKQSTAPIKDALEMGFSSSNEHNTFQVLIKRLEESPHYPNLFKRAFGSSEITEDKMQRALAQFIRSIQSFDSRFDLGMEHAQSLDDDFNNFSAQENLGKQLFLTAPKDGGMGCQGCHEAPEFSINPETGNNGIVDVDLNLNDGKIATTRSPSLRDLFNSEGRLNGPMMHNASMLSISKVLEHYQSFPLNPLNSVDGGVPPHILFSEENKKAVEAFLKTLSSQDLYLNPKWSNPFDDKGALKLDSLYQEPMAEAGGFSVRASYDQIILYSENPLEKVEILDLNGVKIQQIATNKKSISIPKTTLSAKIIVFLVIQQGEVHAKKLYSN